MRPLTVATMLVLPALGIAGVEHVHAVASPEDTAIKVTINPEARVSVSLAGLLPPPVRCGTPAELSIKIINQGFVTSRLEVNLVGDARGAKLEFHPEPLKGIVEELRTLHITLGSPGLTDLTLAFKSRGDAPDLGARDRIHFLLECL